MRKISIGIISTLSYLGISQGTIKSVDRYNTWQSISDEIPKKDLVIIMGDFNAKIGGDNTRREGVIGRQGEGEIIQLGNSL